MAKKKEKEERPNLLNSMLAGAKQEFGDRAFSGPDGRKLLIGLPLPSLSLMYLFDANIFALGKTMGIAGAPMAQKSSLGYEVQRWFACFTNNGQNGVNQHIEAEAGKYSPTLHESVITKEKFGQVIYTQAQSVDEAQEISVTMLDNLKEACQKKAALCNIPVNFTVDSLTGSETEANREKLNTEGSLGGNYPRMAKAWTEFFRTFPTFMIGWPVAFVFINHLKEAQASMPGLPPPKYTPGGGGQRYAAGYYIYMKRIKSEQKQTLMINGEEVTQPHEIRTLELEMNKTSLGYDGRRIVVDFVFYRKDNDQFSYFDWDASTTYLLAHLQGEKGKGVVKKDLREICDMDCAEKRYSSKRMGLKGVTATEMGRAIHDDQGLMIELFDFLQLQRYPIFNGVMPTADSAATEIPREITLMARSTLAAIPVDPVEPPHIDTSVDPGE